MRWPGCRLEPAGTVFYLPITLLAHAVLQVSVHEVLAVRDPSFHSSVTLFAHAVLQVSVREVLAVRDACF